MALQRWWEGVTYNLWYQTSQDVAYLRHQICQGIEQNLREIIQSQGELLEASREQMKVIEHGFANLGIQIRDLQSTIAWSMGAIVDAIESLERTMSWGFAQVIWQQEQTNQLLREILKRLSSPRTTEAEELRERGNEYFQNGLNAKRPEDRERWMNLAIDAYLEAIRKNPADFTVFHSLGVIQFFEKGNSDIALKCFQEAAALAEPYSSHHAAMAWLYLSYVHRNRNELEEACQATLEAIRLQPDWAEANYQHAIHCALTGRMDEMKKHLKAAIDKSEEYFPKAAVEPYLIVHPQVISFLEDLLQQAKKYAESCIAQAQASLKRASKLFNELRANGLPPAGGGLKTFAIAEDAFKKSQQEYRQGGYISYLEASRIAQQVIADTEKAIEEVTKAIREEIEKFHSKAQSLKCEVEHLIGTPEERKRI